MEARVSQGSNRISSGNIGIDRLLRQGFFAVSRKNLFNSGSPGFRVAHRGGAEDAKKKTTP